jgi:hypothetical protein
MVLSPKNLKMNGSTDLYFCAAVGHSAQQTSIFERLLENLVADADAPAPGA